jgi:hypothetical protein
MPKPKVALASVSIAKLRGIARVKAAKPIKIKFPKKVVTKAGAAKAAKQFRATSQAARATRNPDVRVVAVRPTTAVFSSLRTIAESPTAPATMIGLKVGPTQLFGTLFSALATNAFITLEAEYRRRRTGSPAQIALVDAQWRKHVASLGEVFAQAGLRGVGEEQLRSFAANLRADPKNYNAVLKIASSVQSFGPPSPIAATGALVASFVEQTGVIKDLFGSVVTPIQTICSSPISQGTFTKHFSYSIALSVRIPYPCGISWSGIKWCYKTVTLAGVSFDLAMNVGYKVTCCGATVWGQVAGQACATIVGISVCATCTATVIGVAGVSRTPVAGGCSYGLGINATLKCTLAGASILNMSYPFGWTVTGPCPPAGLCP